MQETRIHNTLNIFHLQVYAFLLHISGIYRDRLVITYLSKYQNCNRSYEPKGKVQSG